MGKQAIKRSSTGRFFVYMEDRDGASGWGVRKAINGGGEVRRPTSLNQFTQLSIRKEAINDFFDAICRSVDYPLR